VGETGCSGRDAACEVARFSAQPASGEEIKNRLTDHLRGGRCAEKSAGRAVVENLAPLQVFDGGIVRHGIEHRAQPFIFKGKLLRLVLVMG
jgi:hypothetical protein